MQELVDKAPRMPEDVRWHFIGHLQSNKVKFLLEGCPSLAMLETVDSAKLATKLNHAVAALGREPLLVMLQALHHVCPCCCSEQFKRWMPCMSSSKGTHMHACKAPRMQGDAQCCLISHLSNPFQHV